MRESNVVTKVFEVEYVTPPEMPIEDDDFEFQEDLEKQKTMVTVWNYIFCKGAFSDNLNLRPYQFYDPSSIHSQILLANCTIL